MLEYLRITEDKLIDMFSTHNIIKIITNANHKGYVHDKFKNKFDNEDPCHIETIIDSFKLKKLEKTKTEEPFIPPQETIGERVKFET